MSTESKARGRIIALVLWIFILAIVVVAAKFLIFPRSKDKLQKQTGSESQYTKGEVSLALDSFSGYAIFRSPVFRDQLKAKGIKLTLQDDQADYLGRMKALRDGKANMAVYTVDSFELSGAAIGEYPATMITVIDESQGADAIVVYKTAINKLEDLNDPDVKVVLTRNSPSEFLARIVMSHLSVNIDENRWISANGSSDVYAQFKSANKSAKRAYVMWEPDVSKALLSPDATVLLDSSRIKGYIIDGLFCERKFLRDNTEIVSDVVEAYFRSAYFYQQQSGGLVQLFMDDAKATGQSISLEQAQRLAKGICLKNTLENYAHLGLINSQDARGLKNIEDIIADVSQVLVQTGAVTTDPVAGKANTLFYDKVLKHLQDENFHPGRTLNILSDQLPGTLEDVRGVTELPALSESQWDQLMPVGEMRIKPLIFGRASAELTIQSQRDLDELVSRLSAWPTYYLLVVGHASAKGDMSANLALAQARADAVAQYLLAGGVGENRLKAKAEKPLGTGTDQQSVTLLLGQMPY